MRTRGPLLWMRRAKWLVGVVVDRPIMLDSIYVIVFVE